MPPYRVVVFLNNAASGATLGYYGTLLERHNRGGGRYRVHVPALDQVVTVCDGDMLVVGGDKLHQVSDAESEWLLANQKWEVEFASPLEHDNLELWGKYRIGSRLVGKFHFLKRNQACPTYCLAIPAEGNDGKGKLQYFVPADRVLNREVVMLALSDLFDVKIPAKDVGESTTSAGD